MKEVIALENHWFMELWICKDVHIEGGLQDVGYLCLDNLRIPFYNNLVYAFIGEKERLEDEFNRRNKMIEMIRKQFKAIAGSFGYAILS